MKTYQVWFVNEEVLVLQAEKATAGDGLATFFVADDVVAAFSFEQILGFCNTEAIISEDDDEDEDDEFAG